MRHKAGRRVAGDHLRRAGPARRRRRLVADRRRRRARATASSSSRQHPVVVDRRPGHHGGRRHLRSRSTRRTPPTRPSTSSATPAPRVAFVGGRGAVRAPRGRPRRGAARSPGSSSFDAGRPLDLADSCPLSVPLEHPVSPALAGPRRRRVARRRGDDHLHLGDDRRPEGRRPDLREPRRPVRGDRRATSRWTERDRSLCFLPLSHAYERAWTFYILSKGARELLPRGPEARRRGACRRCGRPAWSACRASTRRSTRRRATR